MATLIKLKPDSKGAIRYAVRWKTPQGKTKQENFGSRADAELFRSQKNVERPALRKVVAPNFKKDAPTLSAVANAFLSDKEHPKEGDPAEPVTIRVYRSILQEHVLPHLGEKRVDTITKEDFRKVYDFARKEGMSPRTWREALRLVGAVLTFAERKGVIAIAPKHDIDTRPTRKERAKTRLDTDEKPYTPDEVYTMLRAADSLAQDANKQIASVWARYRPMVYFFVYTGARLGEVRGFPRKDYRKAESRVHITQSAPEGAGSDFTKSVDGYRKLPLNPALCEPMDTWLGVHKGKLAFGTKTDAPISAPNLYPRLLGTLKDRCDLLAAAGTDPRFVKVSRDKNFHAFRHHFAAWMIREGANLKQLQTYMGHATAAFTLQVYGHLFEDDGHDLAAKMVI